MIIYNWFLSNQICAPEGECVQKNPRKRNDSIMITIPECMHNRSSAIWKSPLIFSWAASQYANLSNYKFHSYRKGTLSNDRTINGFYSKISRMFGFWSIKYKCITVINLFTCVSFVELQPWTQFCITTGSINVNTAAYFRHHSPRNTNYVSWFSLFLFWSLMIMLVDIDSQLVCIIPLNGNNLTHFHFIHTNLVFFINRLFIFKWINIFRCFDEKHSMFL